jgi:hypothetical protein
MAELFWLSDLQWAAILHHKLNPFLGGAGHERLLLPCPASSSMVQEWVEKCEVVHT